MDFGIVGIAAITVLAYLLGMWVKVSKIDNKWIPCVVGTFGLLLGIAALYVMPGFPADNLIEAMAVGVVSGLAATGANELKEQLKGGER